MDDAGAAAAAATTAGPSSDSAMSAPRTAPAARSASETASAPTTTITPTAMMMTTLDTSRDSATTRTTTTTAATVMQDHGGGGQDAIVVTADEADAARERGERGHVPEGGVASAAPTKEGEAEEVKWVEFEPGDPENPFNLPRRTKWLLTVLLVFFTGEVAATAGAYVPGIASMERELNITNHELSLLGISLYALGFGIPPLVLAPFTETFGRVPSYLSTHLVYTVLFIGIGRADNVATVLVLRFLQGAMGSTGSTLVGGTLADIWDTSERGGPMALFATGAIFGTGFGPFWAGFVEGDSRLGWRWIQYIQAMYTGANLIVMALLLKETRGSVLLTRRARKLRKETGDERYRARAESERTSFAIFVRDSLTRPLWLLATEPIVLSFSLWISFLWGFMYMLLESIGFITALHNYTPGQTGLVFLSLPVAALIGNATNPLQEYLYRRSFARRGAEARLYFAMVGAVCFPVGCFIYGWTSYPNVSIAGPVVGIVVLMFGVYTIYLCVFNYLSDGYLIYASSALAAQSFLRNVFGFAFPLFVTQMYRNLGYQWSSTLAGLLGAVLGLVPFVLFFLGPQIRRRSRFSQQLLRDAAEQKAKELERRQDKPERDDEGVDGTTAGAGNAAASRRHGSGRSASASASASTLTSREDGAAGRAQRVPAPPGPADGRLADVEAGLMEAETASPTLTRGSTAQASGQQSRSDVGTRVA